ncbi:hypothetical protein [Treponema berlinense]|uniref:hypothetical protein n=1 Tax=Treponema berlinense TaxID=225004 RepID=UPI0026EC2568|nr:hypothetical protein [Treponema berlinense]
MKKIVTAAVIAAMAASFAAAEVTISSNFRIRPVIVQNDSGTEAASKTTWASLNNSQLSAGQSAADTIKFTAKSDYAGIVTEVNVASDAEKSALTISNFNGFLKFGPSFTLTGGILDSRVANRITNDQNNLSLIEQNWGAKGVALKKPTEKNTQYVSFSGNKKLGVNPNMFAGLKAFGLKDAKNNDFKAIGADSDNITAIEGSKALSLVGDYLLSDVAGGKLQFWGALNKADSEWTTKDDGETTQVVNSSYAFRAAYTNESITADATFHVAKREFIVAAFVSPKMIDNLAATVGFTFAKNTESKNDKTFYAIDARARYAINALSLNLLMNYSSADSDDFADDPIGVLDTVLNATYKINDTVKAFAEAEFVLNTNSDAKDAVGHQLAAQAGTILTAGKGCTVEAAVRGTLLGLGYDDKTTGGKDFWGTSISIPVVMRVKL